MALLTQNQLLGKNNNYLIGSNLFNAFVVGEISSEDDFCFVGAEPIEESNYPLLSGRFFDSEGDYLFGLVQNELVINPGKCSKIAGDPIEYEIHDVNDQLILKVKTTFETITVRVPNPDFEAAVKSGDWEKYGNPSGPTIDKEGQSWVTRIEGRFYNNRGQELLTAGHSGLVIPEMTKCALGFSGQGFMFGNAMSKEELATALKVISSHGLLET